MENHLFMNRKMQEDSSQNSIVCVVYTLAVIICHLFSCRIFTRTEGVSTTELIRRYAIYSAKARINVLQCFKASTTEHFTHFGIKTYLNRVCMQPAMLY